jgi:WD40 repeat protein
MAVFRLDMSSIGGGGVVRRWRLTLLVLAGVLAAVASTVLAVALNVATGGTARWFPTMERYPLWWTGGATMAVAGAGLLVWWAQRWYDQGSEELLPAVLALDPWVVDRPDEVNEIVAVLRRKAAMGNLVAVHGAGGFGKTTVAGMVRADPRVLRHFQGRVHRVTVGRDVRGQELVGLVNGLIKELQPEPVTFTSVEQAAGHLAAVLNAGPLRLLIIDDVWAEEQLSAFPVAGRCARLVTTRNETLAVAAGVLVKIGPMSAKQSRTVLLAGLEPLPPVVVQGLIRETGQWPLMMGLVNKILRQRARLHNDISHAAEDLLSTIRGARLQVDELTGKPVKLDVNDPEQRRRAMRATIEASTGLLTAADRGRLAELGVFTRNETIPVPLVASLWHETGSLDQEATESLCARLADLALVTLTRTGDGGALELHDVIREFLHEDLGPARLQQLHQALLDTVSQGLPAATPADTCTDAATMWWQLPESARYMRDNLIGHLIAAGRPQEAEAVATDLRWTATRLDQGGPTIPYTDLALIGTPRAERLRALLGQAAHLLAPTDPPHSLTDILFSRVSHDPDWGPQAKTLATTRTLPALANVWPLPDLPSPALRRTLTGHTGPVRQVAAAPDGFWLATVSSDRTVRVWDAATWRQRAVLTGHTGPVTAVVIAPDSSWLATVSSDRTVRVWDAATWQQRAVLDGHPRPAWALALSVTIAPDGSWLATEGEHGTVRIWDAVTWRQRAVLDSHNRTARELAVAIAPDGTWLATAADELTVRIWDTATWRQRAVLDGHTRPAWAVAIAPDSTWLATSSEDKTVRIWDTATAQSEVSRAVDSRNFLYDVKFSPDNSWLATTSRDSAVRIWDAVTGRQRGVLTGYNAQARAVAVAPDGTWLATTSSGGRVLIWDAATGHQRAILAGYTSTSAVTGVTVAPDGTWLATSSRDGTVRIWDAATAQQRAVLDGHTSRVRVAAVAPDGTWLATIDGETAQIWDLAAGQQRAVLDGRIRQVRAGAVVVAPDGTWLVAAGDDETVRIWDAATGQQRAVLDGHISWVRAVAVAPDGTWLAASGDETVRIWDAATGQQRALLDGHTGSPVVAVAPDGTWLATTSRDGTVRIWDPATGRISALMRVESQLEGCTWSPSGDLLAVAGDAIYLFAFKPKLRRRVA